MIIFHLAASDTQTQATENCKNGFDLKRVTGFHYHYPSELLRHMVERPGDFINRHTASLDIQSDHEKLPVD